MKTDNLGTATQEGSTTQDSRVQTGSAKYSIYTGPKSGRVWINDGSVSHICDVTARGVDQWRAAELVRRANCYDSLTGYLATAIDHLNDASECPGDCDCAACQFMCDARTLLASLNVEVQNDPN